MDASALEHEPGFVADTQEPKDNLDALKGELDGPELEEMTDEQLRDSVDDINEDLLDYLKIKSKSKNKEEARRAKLQLKIYDDMLELFEDIKPLIEEEKFDKAEAKTLKFLDKVEKRLGKEDIADEKIKEALSQTQDLINLYGEMVDVTKKRAGVGMVLLSSGIDLIPFVGGAKIAAEGVVGRSMTGDKYGIFKRLFKVGEGAFWITVDTAGVIVGLGSFGSGAAVVEGTAIALKGAKGVKAAGNASKLAHGLSTSAAVIRAAKGTSKGGRALASVARFAVKHPSLVTKADDVIKVGKTVGHVTDVRDTVNITKKIVKAPVDWGKRKLVLRRFRQEREEFVAALGKTLDSGAA